MCVVGSMESIFESQLELKVEDYNVVDGPPDTDEEDEMVSVQTEEDDTLCWKELRGLSSEPAKGMRSRAIKDIYSDDTTNANANAAKLRAPMPSDASAAAASSILSSSSNGSGSACEAHKRLLQNQDSGLKDRAGALIRCDSRVSMVSDACSYGGKRRDGAAMHSTQSARSLSAAANQAESANGSGGGSVVTSGDCNGVSGTGSLQGRDRYPESGGMSVSVCLEVDEHRRASRGESGDDAALDEEFENAGSGDDGSKGSKVVNYVSVAGKRSATAELKKGCEPKRGKKNSNLASEGVKLPEVAGDRELHLEFVEVGKAVSRRSRNRARKEGKNASQVSDVIEVGQEKDLQSQRSFSGLRKRRSTSAKAGGLDPEDGWKGESRMKRERKYLILSCESPTVSEQSSLKTSGGQCQQTRSLNGAEECNSSRNRKGDVSPVSVLCAAAVSNSSESGGAGQEVNVEVGWNEEVPVQQIVAPHLTRCHSSSQPLTDLDSVHTQSFVPEAAGDEFFRDSPSCENVQDSQLQCLMTSMLEDISGIGEMDLADPHGLENSLDKQGNLPGCYDDHQAGVGVSNLENSQGKLQGNDCNAAQFSHSFKHDLEIADFEVEFLQLLQGEGDDRSDPAISTDGIHEGSDIPLPSCQQSIPLPSCQQSIPGIMQDPAKGNSNSNPQQQIQDSSQPGSLQLVNLAISSTTEAFLNQQCAAPPVAATDTHLQWAPPWGAPSEDSSEYNGIRLVHLLLAGAEAAATSNTDLVSVILARLKDLCSKTGSTLHRVAAYFSEGLQSRMDQMGLSGKGGSSASNLVEIAKCEPIADLLGAFQILHEISPYIKFAHFTANQAILEAFENERRVHIIDYDIMEGVQWPSLMQDLAARPGGPPHLRITALCRGGSGGSKRTPGSLLSTVQETGRRLSEFAASLHIPFSFHQAKVDVESSQEFKPAVLKLVKGEAIAVNCMLHLPHMGSGGGMIQSSRTTVGAVHSFFAAMHKLSPVVMTVVEEELSCCFPSQGGPGNFVSFFFDALHHYSAIFDSLEASLGPESSVRQLVERIFLAPRISNVVANFSSMGQNEVALSELFAESEKDHSSLTSHGNSTGLPSGLSEGGFEEFNSCKIYNYGTEEVTRKEDTTRHWSSLAFAAGFVPNRTSYKGQWQAKLLLSLFRDGYRLEQQDHRLVLGWRSKPLISASAWSCKI